MSKFKFILGCAVGTVLGMAAKTALDNREAFTAAVLDKIQDVRDDFADFKEYVSERIGEANLDLDDETIDCSCDEFDFDDDEGLQDTVDEIIEKMDDAEDTDEQN